MRSLRGANARAVIKRLNPIIRGWAAYYRAVVSSETFSSAGRLHVEAHLQMGELQPPEQTDALGDRPVLRPVQQVQERPLGVRRPRQAAPTSTSSPGPGSSDTRSSRARRPRTTPPWPTTGPGDGARRHPCRSTRPACGSSRPSTAAARSAGLAPLRRRPATKPTRVGTLAGHHPQDDHQTAAREDGTSDETEPRLTHAHCLAEHRHPATAQHFCPPTSLQGLLEPDARETVHVRLYVPRTVMLRTGSVGGVSPAQRDFRG